MTDEARDPVRVFTGRALVALGALILGLSGLCTLAFAGVTLWSDLRQRSAYSSFSNNLPLMLILGGVPMLTGFGIIRWGMWILGRRRRAAMGADDG